MKQKVLVSVDVEGPAGKLPVERMIYGQAKDGKEYGINYLMDLFDKNNIKALFFVDIPEIIDHGTEKIEQVMLDINERGHDVGVHVHPDHMNDINRRYLWEYTEDEQYEIIARCTDFYINTLKRTPKSFRAGRYGANNETLKVLDRLGYQYDMSEFYASRYCKINPPVTWNRVVKCGNVQLKEVPVTTIRSFATPFYSRNDQIDSGRIPGEFRRYMKEIERTGAVDVVSMFFHSFQFLDWRSNPDSPSFSKQKYRYVLENLEYLKSNNAVFIAESDLDDIKENEIDKLGAVDTSKGIGAYYYFSIHAVKTLWERIVLNV